MNARKTNSLKSNLQTLVQDGGIATELVAQLLEELRLARENKERQDILTSLAQQLLCELER
jgi:hypothetical protein